MRPQIEICIPVVVVVLVIYIYFIVLRIFLPVQFSFKILITINTAVVKGLLTLIMDTTPQMRGSL